jgi:hypothetical protein
VWIDARAELASMPERPPPVLEVMYPAVGFQYDCRKQRALSACSVYVLASSPSAVASAAPSRRERCCTAVVKKDEDWTSSQRSKPVWFQLDAT